MPAWPNRSSSAADQCGSTVEHMTKVLPGFMAAAAPPAPNSPDSVCAAALRSEGRPHARPQIAHMHCIAVGTQRLCDACTHGAQADDSCFFHGAGCLSGG